MRGKDGQIFSEGTKPRDGNAAELWARNPPLPSRYRIRRAASYRQPSIGPEVHHIGVDVVAAGEADALRGVLIPGGFLAGEERIELVVILAGLPIGLPRRLGIGEAVLRIDGPALRRGRRERGET